MEQHGALTIQGMDDLFQARVPGLEIRYGRSPPLERWTSAARMNSSAHMQTDSAFSLGTWAPTP